MRHPVQRIAIIPYQELLGNYDSDFDIPTVFAIIPYQELLGNYDFDYIYEGID